MYIKLTFAAAIIVTLASCGSVEQKVSGRYIYDPATETRADVIRNIQLFNFCGGRPGLSVSEPSSPRPDGKVEVTFDCLDA